MQPCLFFCITWAKHQANWLCLYLYLDQEDTFLLSGPARGQRALLFLCDKADAVGASLDPLCWCSYPVALRLLQVSRHCLVTSGTYFAQGVLPLSCPWWSRGVVQIQPLTREFRRLDISAQRWGSVCFRGCCRGCCRGRKGPDSSCGSSFLPPPTHSSPPYPFPRECLLKLQ